MYISSLSCHLSLGLSKYVSYSLHYLYFHRSVQRFHAYVAIHTWAFHIRRYGKIKKTEQTFLYLISNVFVK